MADGKNSKDAPPPDLAILAEQFLDLWQGQLTAWASDPELAERTARMWGAWGMMPPRPAAAAPRPASDDQNRPEAAASPFGELLGELRQLNTRLGAMEQRLADLERSERERSGRRPESSPRNRRRRS
jgi:hypothetical protein